MIGTRLKTTAAPLYREAERSAHRPLCRVALLGSPNSGKTTLYNLLTDSSEYEGNRAGVTVEKKERRLVGRDYMTLVDLPGVYSLSPYSPEEALALGEIIKAPPDILIILLDGNTLMRSLALALEALELKIPAVVAINMMDEVRRTGGSVDEKLLEALLGAAVVPISARENEGITALLGAVSSLYQKRYPKQIPDMTVAPPSAGCSPYENTMAGRFIESVKELIEPYLKDRAFSAFYARILLANDGGALVGGGIPEGIRLKINALSQKLKNESGYSDCAELFSTLRFKKVDELAAAAIKKGSTSLPIEKIDTLATARFTAIPILLIVIGLMFYLTFGFPGSFLKDAFQGGIMLFSEWVRAGLMGANAPAAIISIVCDAIIGGVMGVLVFLPQIAVMFLLMCLLEESGYLARAAFLLDKPMRRLGLSGKAVIPMLLGFGCTTTAVMATRTIENEREREAAISLIPFMSCSARLPIYAMFTSVFFKGHEALVMLLLYLLGVFVAIICGMLFKKAICGGCGQSLVVELPRYRVPKPKAVAKRVLNRSGEFLLRAGTVILFLSIIIWFCFNLTPSFRFTAVKEESILFLFSKALSPIFLPLGFNSPEATSALLTGVVAKESVVSTLSVLWGGDVGGMLLSTFNQRSAVAFMVFSLLYTPCISAVASMSSELDSGLKAAGIAVFETLVAYLAAFLIYSWSLMLPL